MTRWLVRRWPLLSLLLAAALLAGLALGVGREAQAARSTKLRLAYGAKIHYGPQIIALKKGRFAAEGLDVEAKVVQAGIQAAEAMTSGSADAAVMGDAPAIIALASGMPLKLVASYGGGERMHRLVAAPGSSIHKPADLVGKRVALQMGSSTHGAFLLFLSKHKVDVKSVKLVPLDPSDMPEAMISRQIDAAVGSEPWPSNIEERVKGSYDVATLSGLGNNFPLVMLVTERYAREHPDAVASALRATQQAVDFMHQHPGEAAAVISETTGVPAAKEQKVMQTLEWRVTLDAATINSLKQTADFLEKQGKIAHQPDWKRAIDQSLIRKAGLR
jgi:sulfonate transport system substrate-binding protein